MKKFAWLTFLTGLLLSGVAGFYSVVGLSMIFASAFWSVAALASILELAKIVSVTWMYRYRFLAGRTVTGYFYSAIILMMLITSMGIFGYLTRAHVGTDTVIMTSELTIAEIAQREAILTQQRTQLTEELGVATQQSNQLVSQLGKAERFIGASGAVRVQRETSARRETLLSDIKKINAELSTVQRERIAAQTSTATATADVGPLRYVARAIYGSDDLVTIRKAVIWLTVILMLVFDPLAVMLLIAANILFVEAGRPKTVSHPETVPAPLETVTPDPPPNPRVRVRSSRHGEPRGSKSAQTVPESPALDILAPEPQKSVPVDPIHGNLHTRVSDVPVPLLNPEDWFARNKYLATHAPSIVDNS